jgi:hypothetical protein
VVDSVVDGVGEVVGSFEVDAPGLVGVDGVGAGACSVVGGVVSPVEGATGGWAGITGGGGVGAADESDGDTVGGDESVTDGSEVDGFAEDNGETDSDTRVEKGSAGKPAEGLVLAGGETTARDASSPRLPPASTESGDAGVTSGTVGLAKDGAGDVVGGADVDFEVLVGD